MNNPFEPLVAKLNEIEAVLQELSATVRQQTSGTPKDIMNVEEAAAFLNLAVPTIYGLVQRKVIPVSKRGKRLYFSRQELEKWIKEGRRKTIDEIQSDTSLILRGRRKRR